MKRLYKINDFINFPPLASENRINDIDRKFLSDIGLRVYFHNTELYKKPNHEQICEAARILEKYYGRMTSYMLWYGESIKMWRLIYGN